MTTPVGSYPSGLSPFGALDMTGNVWEWTSSLCNSYPYNATDGQERAAPTKNRVLRGGSWGRYARVARAAHRFDDRPDNANSFSGFRLARAVPNS
jgi:formylglycine-generating enzyme required for sulfatase activity